MELKRSFNFIETSQLQNLAEKHKIKFPVTFEILQDDKIKHLKITDAKPEEIHIYSIQEEFILKRMNSYNAKKAILNSTKEIIYFI